MRVKVNGCHLYFDVDGASLAYADGRLAERPTLLLIHGGPGYDHLAFKPYFSRFADICQVVYVDLRGHGRSDEMDASTWNLAQWAADLAEFCQVLGIHAPIILGQSYGGYVLLELALAYPVLPGKLILSSTAPWRDRSATIAAFRDRGGDAAADACARTWDAPTIENYADYLQHCIPLYNATPQRPTAGQFTQFNIPLMIHAFAGEANRFDYRERLAEIAVPTLVLCGDADPVTPLGGHELMARRIPNACLEVVPGAGHGVWRDAPEAAERILRAFIAATPETSPTRL